MKTLRNIWILTGLCLGMQIARAEAFPTFGVDSVSSEFFREWYQNGDLRHYLDNYSDYVTYEAETTGEWGTPEQMVFSINGNSYRWNRLYLNGFRIDSRFQSGSTYFQLNMQEQNLYLNQHRGTIHFQTDSFRHSKVWLSNNIGALGGINPSTQKLINLYHQTASQRTQEGNNLLMRDYIKGMGQAEVTYGIPYDGRRFYQHIYAGYGRRMLNAFDTKGISGQYMAPYYKVQIDGQLPLPKNSVVDRLSYYLVAQRRPDLYSEFMFNQNEVATQKMHTAALYATKGFAHHDTLTTGISWALNDVQHRTIFRNLIDQDGEGFEPWYANGKHNEINWAVNYRRPLLPWLSLHLDCYNSLMLFNPSGHQAASIIYTQDYNDAKKTTYNRIEWSSKAFAGGLLENQVTLEARKRFSPVVELQGQLALTLDGICLRQHSVVSPNWEAMIGVHLTPHSWFTMDISLGNYRSRYTYEDMLYLSPDYLNGQMQYLRNDLPFATYNTTGGAYHTPAKGLMQSSYAVLDIPLRFHFDSKHGHHEFSLLSSVRLYYNQWTTQFAGAPEDYGHYEDGIFFYNSQNTQYEIVNMQNSTLYPNHFLIHNPLWLSNVAKYSFTSKHVFVSFSWQSYQLSGVSALGNGPLQNNLNALSESTANPNILLNAENPKEYRMLGRLDQDRSFIARLQVGCNITKQWSISLTGKFKDGTPFSSFRTAYYDDPIGTTQAAVYNVTTKGINVIDGHFGRRKDAFFNFDLHARFRGNILMVPITVEATCYNVYDWGTELVEYTFEDHLKGGLQRRALQLNIPRGVIISVSVGLEQEKQLRSIASPLLR
ncbi:MAG: hypothetical protein IKN59_00670 [Paludibacteraceae bacterium]|nr:hypothetical protein [Paludibacteraceae bacterium]